MDEILEELLQAAESVPVPLELPEHEQLVDIEEEILLPIPPLFREFLLTASDNIYGSLEPATGADPSSHTYLAEMTAAAWDQGLPRDLMPICAHREGYYVVTQEDEIQIWSPVDGLETAVAETIWYWVRDIWLNS